MELYQLKTFVAVARIGHLTKASEKLHISQPAVSKQIRALEDELGVVLFSRSTTGSLLTSAGEIVLPLAEKTLASAADIIEAANKIRGEKAGRIRLGTIIDPEILRLGATLGKLLEHHPGIEVQLTHGISGRIMELIEARELDAGYYLGRISDRSYHVTELCLLNYLIAAPLRLRAEIASAHWRDIMKMPWIGTPLHSSQHRLTKEISVEQGSRIVTVIEADQESTMRNLVIQGVGLCLLREDIASKAEAEGLLVTWRGTKRVCPLSFVFKKHLLTDVLMEELQHFVADVWATSGGLQA